MASQVRCLPWFSFNLLNQTHITLHSVEFKWPVAAVLNPDFCLGSFPLNPDGPPGESDENCRLKKKNKQICRRPATKKYTHASNFVYNFMNPLNSSCEPQVQQQPCGKNRSCPLPLRTFTEIPWKYMHISTMRNKYQTMWPWAPYGFLVCKTGIIIIAFCIVWAISSNLCKVLAGCLHTLGTQPLPKYNWHRL